MTVEDEDRLGARQRQRRVALVRDDADDVVPRGLRRGDAQEQTLADRRLAAKRARREVLVDDDLPRQVGSLIDVVVGVGEGTPGDEPRAHRLEVSRQHAVEVRLPERARIGHRGLGAPAPGDQQAVERQRRRGGDALHAGDRVQLARAPACLNAARCAGLLLLCRQEERQEVGGIVARVDAPQRDDAAKHQPGADQQDERQGNLRHHDAAAERAAAAEAA